MAAFELKSNLKYIASGAIPTTTTLPSGNFAFGVINGKPRLFGNVNGVISEYGLETRMPYVVTLDAGMWTWSDGNYSYSILATTHGKGAYPSVHTYVANADESLWEETYNSPAIDASGNITLYSNMTVLMRVVIK
jgi:hypothetical protein|nr:MAG TPA: hypothetical protein [Caudoviricetes sp.]